MMTRDELRELAVFQADETKGACALSFYFQPDPPQDRSHRREAIVAKDIAFFRRSKPGRCRASFSAKPILFERSNALTAATSMLT